MLWYAQQGPHQVALKSMMTVLPSSRREVPLHAVDVRRGEVRTAAIRQLGERAQ